MHYVTVWETGSAPISEARQAVRALLGRAGYRPDHRTSQDAQLVVSELVTNAHRHAPGPGRLELEVIPDAALLRIRVRDSSPHQPQLQPPAPGRIGGHGLHLVTRLSTKLHTLAQESGKQVVAHLHLHAADEQRTDGSS
ncbi:ATP-binding protein [Streptomyces sp. NPDC086787]|uniref:ATP-binding protein n=1 Tax=Streptomyces sp. NPDC086787 TaxID=3365759 RepID=UPI00382DCC4C